jgi:hypothetical protein
MVSNYRRAGLAGRRFVGTYWATDRRSRSAGDDLCPAVGSAYGRQYLLPLVCALAADNCFGSAPPVAGLEYRRHCGRRTVGGSHNACGSQDQWFLTGLIAYTGPAHRFQKT